MKAAMRAGLVLPIAALLAGLAPAAPARAAAAEMPREVMILLDVNISFPDATFAAERGAALAYVRALPPDVRAGLIIFSTTSRLAAAPAADRAAVTALITGATMAGASSVGLQAALNTAAGLVGPAASGGGAGTAADARILVISDGEDLLFSPVAPRVPVDVAVVDSGGDDKTAWLDALTVASGGTCTDLAGTAALAAAFPPSRTVASASPLTAQSSAPARPGAGLPGPGRTAHGSGAASGPGVLSLPWLAGGVFTAMLAACLLVLLGMERRSAGRHLASRFDHYGPRRNPPAESGKLAAGLLTATTRLLRSGNAERGLTVRLDLAGFKGKPAEWTLLVAAAGLAVAVLSTALSRAPVLGLPLGALTSWLGSRLALSAMTARRRAAFSEQLPELLQIVAGSLRSGFSLPQAFEAVARDAAQPTATEISRALAEFRIGADIDVALDGAASRMDSDDFRWTVMAIRIQREVGGNLPEVLDSTSRTIRERAALRRQVRAMSAEGRLSAYILLALPVLIGGWLLLTDRGYLRPLYTTTIGLLMLAGSGLLLVLGGLWMREVIKVEV